MPKQFGHWLVSELFIRGAVTSPRTVEFLLAWMIISWSVGMIPYEDEAFFSSLGLFFGLMRLLALIINGAWRRTPLLRFLGALVGLNWWLGLAGLTILNDLHNGAPRPQLLMYFVLAFFEGYSCYRCAQDAKAMHSLSVSPLGQ